MGCPCNDPNVTPQTIPCASNQPCVEVISTDCVIYTGTEKKCHTDVVYGNGDSLATVHSKIVDYTCNQITVPGSIVSNRPSIGTVVIPGGSFINISLDNIVTWVDSVIATLPAPSGATITNITYSTLLELSTTGTLTQGNYYRITDYQTIYEQPDFTNATTPVATPIVKYGVITPLIVFAFSNTKLSLDAFQEAYPGDRIKYNLQYITPITGTATKGEIFERIDILGNRTSYDHREVRFKRYFDSTTGGYDSYFDLSNGSTELLTFQTGHKNNIIGNGVFINQSPFSTFDLPNIVIKSNTANNNKILGDIWNATVGGNSFFGNEIINIFQNSYITLKTTNSVDTFYSNRIDTILNSKIRVNNFHNNEFDIIKDSVFIADDIHYNDIISLDTITITDQFKYNKGGVLVNLNFTAGASNNDFGPLFTSNSDITGLFQKNIIDATVTGKALNTTNTTRLYLPYNTYVFLNEAGDLKLAYYDASDSRITLLIS